MEEILASIRRIIAEDERPAESAPAALPSGSGPDEVLELTEVLNEDGSVQHIEPSETPSAPAVAPAAAAPPVAPLPDGRIEPAAPRQVADQPGAGPDLLADLPPESAGERILSTASSGAAAAAFARLAGMPRERRQGDMLLGNGDRTLEELVREALRPLLQAWLDENLPELVERLVRAEIARVVGEAGLR